MVTAPPLLTHVFSATTFSNWLAPSIVWQSCTAVGYGSMLRHDRRGAPAANPPLLAWLG